MSHGSGLRASCAILAAFAVLATGAAPASASSSSATVSDGCGRVDSIEVDARGTFWLEALPDGKATRRSATVVDPSASEAEQAAALGYVAFPGRWQRVADASASFLQVRVLQYDGREFRYLPMVLSGAGAGLRGTETLRLTNEDCVQPLAPTFVDEEGSARDTVTIPAVRGVRYSGKPGTTPGKGTVTVTAAAEKGYRLADEEGVPLPESQTRWTYTFDGLTSVQVPTSHAPVFRQGAVTPASGKKPAGRAPNVVVVRYVPGVAWVVDGKAVKVGEKQTIVEVPVGEKTRVEVQAVPADAKAFTVAGQTQWVVSAAPPARPASPRVVAPFSGVSIGRTGSSTVTWSPAPGFAEYSRFNVRYREVRLTANQVRRAESWRAWKQETRDRSGVLRAKPGSFYEVQVQSVAGRRTSAWSSAAPVYFPTDVSRAPNRFWRADRVAPALGGTMITTRQRTASWRTTTPTTNQVLLYFGTSPTGAPAHVYVDGRHVATVQTKSRSTTVRQVLRPIPVRWGSHVVTVVHGGRNGQTLQIDGVAYGR